jgi:hypothetical protein
MLTIALLRRAVPGGARWARVCAIRRRHGSPGRAYRVLSLLTRGRGWLIR